MSEEYAAFAFGIEVVSTLNYEAGCSSETVASVDKAKRLHSSGNHNSSFGIRFVY
jgi:hypothetical protein